MKIQRLWEQLTNVEYLEEEKLDRQHQEVNAKMAKEIPDAAHALRAKVWKVHIKRLVGILAWLKQAFIASVSEHRTTIAIIRTMHPSATLEQARSTSASTGRSPSQALTSA
jgi:hypothetical protein